MCIFVMVMHAVVGLSWAWNFYVQALRYIETVVPLDLPPYISREGLPGQAISMAAGAVLDPDGVINADVFLEKGVKLAFYMVWWTLVGQVITVDRSHRRTLAGLCWCLLVRAVPAISMEWTSKQAPTPEQTISDGLFIAMLTSDVIVAKMSNREFHNLVVLMTSLSIVSSNAIYFSLVVYYFVIVMDICSYMSLPLLTPIINVYCDGVFDMLHLGHMNQFRQAMEVSKGTRLFVGVHCDEDCIPYKRKPVMNEKERYAAVRACKYVFDVIEAAPMVATKEYIDEHSLHIYAIGEEYVQGDLKDDKYYRVPRELGMVCPTKRSKGVSTSDIIGRVQEGRPELFQRKAPAASAPGGSAEDGESEENAHKRARHN
jgi:cytidyltransferase-like protein